MTMLANPNANAVSADIINKRNIQVDVFLFAKSASETVIEYISSAKTRTSVAAANVSNKIGNKPISCDIPSVSYLSLRNLIQAAFRETKF
jgi:hypothetical protein